MRNGVGANEKLKSEQAGGERAQSPGNGARTYARLGRAPDVLNDTQQERSRARCRIENCHLFACEPRRLKIIPQGTIERGNHIGHDLDGRVIDAVALPLGRVEDFQKVFIEIKDRVRFAGLACENGGLEAVHCVEHHIETRADVAHNLLLTEHAQRCAHERVFGRHMPPGFLINRLPACLAREQKSKGEGLSEGCREKGTKPPCVIARRLGVRVSTSRNSSRTACSGALLSPAEASSASLSSTMLRTSLAACAIFAARCLASLAGGGLAKVRGVNALIKTAGSWLRINRSALTSVVSGASAASGTISTEALSSSRSKTRKLMKFETAQWGKE